MMLATHLSALLIHQNREKNTREREQNEEDVEKENERERENKRKRALNGPLVTAARSLFIFVHFGARDNALVTDRQVWTKCPGPPLDWPSRALEIVYDSAERIRAKR